MDRIHRGDKTEHLMTKGAVRGGVLPKGPKLGKAWGHGGISAASHRIPLCMITLVHKGRHLPKGTVTEEMVTQGTVTEVTVTELMVTKVVVTQAWQGAACHRGVTHGKGR